MMRGPQELEQPSVPDIDRLITQAISAKLFSAAACMFSAPVGTTAAALLHQKVYGRVSFEHGASKVEDQGLFALGEVTGTLGPVLLALLWASQGRLDVQRPIGLLLPELAKQPLGQASVAHLLDHTSGLPDSKAAFAAAQAKAPQPPRPRVRAVGDPFELGPKVLSATAGPLPTPMDQSQAAKLRLGLLMTPLAHPPGSKLLASKLNMFVLGCALEAMGKKPLARLLDEEVYKKLGVSTGFTVRTNSLTGPHPKRLGGPSFGAPVAMLACPWRHRLITGEAHDPIAWLLGGLAGHSGLMATVEGVHALCLSLLLGAAGEEPAVHAGTLQRFWGRSKHLADSTHTLGWQVPCRDNGMAPGRWHSSSVGQVGEDGCMIFTDPSNGIVGVLLTNLPLGLSPERAQAWRTLRLKVFDAMASHGQNRAGPQAAGRGAARKDKPKGAKGK